MTEPLMPRWQYRFQNFSKALALLQQAVLLADSRALSDLEKEGLIQRFCYSWELAWKLLKDYLEDQGVLIETVTPAAVIRAAFAAKIIDDGDGWMRALDARNKMAHTYNQESFHKIVQAITSDYTSLLQKLYDKIHPHLLELERP